MKKRQRIGHFTSHQLYRDDLLPAIRKFLPRRGLELQARDNRVRWTDRLLVVMAILVNWHIPSNLTEVFESCWHVVAGMYPTRRRVGVTYNGFIAALVKRSPRLLEIMAKALRKAVRQLAGEAHWRTQGWVVMGVDGSRINCPRTVANEAAFGCAGRAKTAPQQFITTVLHVGTSLVWDWRRGGGKEAERTHLRDMIDTLPKGSLLLADAGFTGYELMRTLIAGGRSFVIRAGGNVKLLKNLGLYVREHDGIVYLWPATHRDQEPLVLRRVILEGQKKPIHLLTNVLDETSLSDSQVAEMYRSRWGLEVFFRSLKRTMRKHKLSSKSPARAQVELDWSMVGIWMLGLLTLERLLYRGASPSDWSVAKSLNVIRRVLSGRGGHKAAATLRNLGKAVKDNYRRKGPKATRPWPRPKKLQPPNPPKTRTATLAEAQSAKRVKETINAA